MAAVNVACGFLRGRRGAEVLRLGGGLAEQVPDLVGELPAGAFAFGVEGFPFRGRAPQWLRPRPP